MQYDPSNLNFRPILSDDDRLIVQAISKACPIGSVFNDNRNFEEWMVDFVYTSAKIEGNTYDRIDTDNLLRMGITAGNKRYSDAKMLVNLRDAFSVAMNANASTQLNEGYFCDLHKVLMVDLLPISEQGLVRTGPVTIGASTYRPLSSPIRLKEELKSLFSEFEKYTDPFERALYLHCNLAYLQFFRDGNKRTARLMQTAALVQCGITPLFFRDTLIADYQRATIDYYETGKFEPYIKFFLKNYMLVAAEMLGQDDLEFSQRIQRVAACSGAKGPP